MSHTVSFSLAYADERRAEVVERSVAPEIHDLGDDRSRATLHREGRTLELAVDARDLTALRAASNTWCSLLSVAEDVAETGPF